MEIFDFDLLSNYQHSSSDINIAYATPFNVPFPQTSVISTEPISHVISLPLLLSNGLLLSIDANSILDNIYGNNNNNDNLNDMAINDDTSISINSSNTFYAKGLLSTVLFPIYANSYNLTDQADSENQTSEIVYRVDPIPKLISGTWSLNVSKGSVLNFDASFKLLSANGIEKHFIKLSNFHSSNESAISFDPFSSTVVNGLVDIEIDNELFKSQFPVNVQISKINTIAIAIHDNDVDNIFLNQDILGITDSFKNFRNDELLIFEEEEEE